MLLRTLRTLPVIALAGLLGACASDGGVGGLFSTASVVPPALEEAKPKVARVDPACVTLASQIDGLRKEGTIDRLEKVAAGKGDKVQVKRTAIAKQAELNKANAEFQAKCGPKIPGSQEAAAPATPTAATMAAMPAAAAATKAVAKAAATTGVTSVAPKAQ